MKILPIGTEFIGDAFDAARPLGEFLISTGKFKEFVPMTRPRPPQSIVWAAHPPVTIQGILEAPYISFFCSTCAGRGQWTGPTVHKTQVVRCCGGMTKCPSDIGKKYEEYRKQYQPKRELALRAQHKAEVDRQELDEKVRQQERGVLAMKLRLPPEEL